VPGVITLTTDFGDGSPYVAAMKGVLLTLAPEATLVDITHGIQPHNIRQGAMVLDQAAPWFPAGTIHLAVVDPGVGTERALVCADIGQQRFLAPDNGVLGLVARRQSPTRVIELTETAYWRQPVSPTFHGRDILAPVAARLASGVDPAKLGRKHAELVALDWPEPRKAGEELRGCVVWVDAFGNLITNISQEMLSEIGGSNCEVSCAGHVVQDMVRAYGQQPPGTLVALVGSAQLLEIALVQGSAAERLGAKVDDPISVRRRP